MTTRDDEIEKPIWPAPLIFLPAHFGLSESGPPIPIEITQAMKDAGEDVLRDNRDGIESEVAMLVFEVMTRLSPAYRARVAALELSALAPLQHSHSIPKSRGRKSEGRPRGQAGS